MALRKYPIFSSLCSNIFYQDWQSEFSSTDEAINFFMHEIGFTTTEELHLELCSLLEKKELNDSLIAKAGGYLITSAEGKSTREWLEHITSLAQCEIDKHYNVNPNK